MTDIGPRFHQDSVTPNKTPYSSISQSTYLEVSSNRMPVFIVSSSWLDHCKS